MIVMDDPFIRFTPPTEEEMEEYMTQQFGASQAPPEPSGHDPNNPDDVTRELLKPFPASAIKVNKFSKLSYVEYQQMIRRLIYATGNRFSVDVLNIEVLPWPNAKSGTEQRLIQATVKLTIPVLESHRTHMGVQVGSVGAGEDMWKGAVSDGIKKAAQAFGVAIDLAGKDGEDADLVDSDGVIHSAPRSQDRPPQAPAPQRQQNAPQQANTQASGRAPMQPGTGGPATDGQKRALWAISNASKDQIDEWAAEYNESNANLTKGTASVLIDQYGGNR